MADYYDLGTYERTVSTTSAEAQRWFNRGLVWTYGFHHEEAVECFEKALEHDPGLAMAHWGIAYAVGPNYNRQWGDFDEEEKRVYLGRALEAVEAASQRAAGAEPVERALIGALAVRYPSDPSVEDFGPWNDAYSEAMREVYRANPNDLDVRALFAEAMMNRTPWHLWDLPGGEPAEGADTLEAVEVLESAFSGLAEQGANTHPGLLHMYIHLVEMSPHPEKALKAGDALVNLVPDAGHLQHMATHIDVLCGHYQNVVARNDLAIVADNKYLARSGAENFYTVYRCHNYHFKIYGAMFLGQLQPAMEAADDLAETLTEDVVRPLADWLEAFVPMKQHVLIRFGMWEEIKAQELPEDRELYSVTTALILYAKTVAYSATGDIPGALASRDEFRVAKAAVPESRVLFNNTCIDILNIAEEMLEGELSYRQGDHDIAFAHLRRSVELDDTLPYDEPWGWMQPARHALGALLLEQGRMDEAEAVYRADLGLDDTLSRASQHPDNVWSLHGLHECLLFRGETGEAGMIKQRLDMANARADVPIEASCFCRLEHAHAQSLE
ncbi:MAG: tetratricopeptide repeat protein [Actinomycetota bacterium]|nr:tetratricopeptide repeat protein [Actinomycetota bacterium]